MKAVIAVLLMVFATAGDAAIYQGKKCKIKWDKEKQEAEAECFETTRSEHTLIIKTVPAVTNSPAPVPAAVPAEPLDSRWQLGK